MKNLFYQHRACIAFIILSFLLLSNCSIPFIGGKKSNGEISVFDDKQYLNVNEYSFREYQWNRDSRAAEEIYIKGLDYFFNKNYKRSEVIFTSALKFYKKDARIYTRLAESYARLHELNKALAVLNECSNELYGYDSLPGIRHYRKELNDMINKNLQVSSVKKRNIFIRIITYPSKIFSLF